MHPESILSSPATYHWTSRSITLDMFFKFEVHSQLVYNHKYGLSNSFIPCRDIEAPLPAKRHPNRAGGLFPSFHVDSVVHVQNLLTVLGV